MRTEWSWHSKFKPLSKVRYIFRIDLHSWYIGFDIFKNYQALSDDYRIKFLCFEFGFRRYWEYKYHV